MGNAGMLTENLKRFSILFNKVHIYRLRRTSSVLYGCMRGAALDHIVSSYGERLLKCSLLDATAWSLDNMRSYIYSKNEISSLTTPIWAFLDFPMP